MASSPSVFDLPELSAEEKSRLPSQGRMPQLKKTTTDSPRTPIGPAIGIGCMSSETARMRTVCDALHHYNAEHPGGEFDAVKSLMEESVYFRGKAWFHINFLARSHSSKNIKRFFAEVHYEAPTNGQSFPLIPIVEACNIIEESFSHYRSSCAFCGSHLDILHPVEDHGFVCGNGEDKDWIIEEWFQMRFIHRVGMVSSISVLEGKNSEA